MLDQAKLGESSMNQILGQIFSHAYVNTMETWTHVNQPKGF